MRVLREIGITVLIAVAVFVALQLNVQSYTVEGSSMVPNIHPREYIMANKASYRSSEPQRGQVIIFDPPFESPRPYIKRVIGLPGETVEIKEGQVLVNGVPLHEPDTIPAPTYEMSAREVPENEYFVLGDNRNSSRDSSDGWTVPRENIIGRAWFTYWPPNEWGLVEHYSYP
jgi:signal peptidase I